MLLLLAACLEYEEGRAEEGELACQLREACDALEIVGYASVDDCIADATSQTWVECEDYREAQMVECVEAWEAAVEAADCDVLSTAPPVCAQVCPAE
jgi:hypothetical protein